jgi:hypothetical protein
MAKFLDKKQQVIDFKLTNYGHYLFSIGDFKPEYYAFFDDNIVYDGAYIGISESQNNIINRIKNETPYIETITLFEEVEKQASRTRNEFINVFDSDLTPDRKIVRKDNFKIDAAIGDAYLDGLSQDVAPAWKVVALGGKIMSTSETDTVNNISVPQINIEGYYKLEVVTDYVSATEYGRPMADEEKAIIDSTPIFTDERFVALKLDQIMLYIEEKNTELLTENFDIEVFEIVTGSAEGEPNTFQRKFFQTETPQIIDGIMMTEKPATDSITNLLSSSVEYYFEVLTDKHADSEMACKGAADFNKKSYYVDIDFECSQNQQENYYYDIYGSEVVPEICLD